MKQPFYYLSLGLAALVLLSACQSSEGVTPLAATPVAPSTKAPASVPTEAPTAAPTAAPTVAPTAAPTSEPTLPPSPEPSPAPTSEPAATVRASGAANADVLYVRAVQTADPSTGSGQGGTWSFSVTVEHPDTGWEDYADGWDVVTPDGTVLKPDPDSPFTRLLLHPHENEQPFTRSQSGIVVPPGVTQVLVRAHDLVDGFGGREVLVDLTVASGEGFEVDRR